MQPVDSEVSRWINKNKNHISLKDFKIRAKLGKGAFGNVYLVQLDEPSVSEAPLSEDTSSQLDANHKALSDNLAGKKHFFAMKVMNKKDIFSQNM